MKRSFGKNYISMVAVLFFCITAHASPGDLDASFNGTGKVRIPVGAYDEVIQLAQGIVRQSDGKIVVAGSSRDISDSAFSAIRYNTNGTIDTTFGDNGRVLTRIGNYGSIGTSAAIQADGKILIGGYVQNTSGYYTFGIARYNSNGSLDASFGSGGTVIVNSSEGYGFLNALTVQSDGKIVAAGNTSSSFVVVRLNSNGSLDTTFSGDGIVTIAPTNAVAVANLDVAMQGTKIVTAGYSGDNAVLTRYNANGSLDATFGSGGIITITNGAGKAYALSLTFAAAYAGEEKIIVSGAVQDSFVSPERITIWSLNQSNGTPDTTFGTSGGKVVTNVLGGGSSVKTQFQNGVAQSIVVAGGAGGNFAVLRYSLNGTPDSTFGSNGVVYADIYDGSSDLALAMFIQPADNKIVVSGVSRIAGDTDYSIARFNKNGTLDTTFDADGKRADDIGNGSDATIKAVATQTDGRILAAGKSSVVRFNPDGALDTTFDLDGKVKAPLGNITSIAIQPNGKIVVAGGDGACFAAARLNSNGSLDTTFGGIGRVKPTCANGYARGIAIQPDGKIVLVGSTKSGSNQLLTVYRYNANGSIDTTFNGSGSSIISINANYQDFANAVTIQSNCKIVVAGQTLSSANNTDIVVVRYNTDGSLDASFNDDGILTTDISQNDMVSSVTQSNGKILVAGSTLNSNAFALVRYNDNGLRDQTFDGDGIVMTDLTLNGLDAGNAVAVQSDGKILVAGYSVFSSTNHDFAVARYNTNGLLDTTYSGDGRANIDFIGGVDEGFAIAIDSFGRAVVGGAASGYVGIARLQN